KARNEHQQEEQARRLRDFFGVGPNQDVFYAKQSYKVSGLVESLAVTTQEDMDRYACSEATYCMKAYYKVAMKVLVDNFSVLAVEKCLLRDLANILSPDIIIKLSDGEVNALAAESETSMLERRRATDDLTTLQEGLTVLNRFSRSSGTGAADATDDDDEEEEEEDEEAMAPPNDDVAPSIRFTETEKETLVLIREEPKLEAFETVQEQPVPASLPYEEAIPVDDDSGTYYGKKDKKKGKKGKKSRVSEYAAPEEPPPAVPIQEDVVPLFAENTGWGFGHGSAIK
ncbi:MAG: hypothetical protein Q9192_007662, partial [Flavoplaca navasiana]